MRRPVGKTPLGSVFCKVGRFDPAKKTLMLNAHIEDYLNFEDTIKLYDWGFSDFSYRNVVDTQTPVYELDVELAENDAKAVLYPTERIRLLLPRDTSDEDIHLDYTIYNTGRRWIWRGRSI